MKSSVRGYGLPLLELLVGSASSADVNLNFVAGTEPKRAARLIPSKCWQILGQRGGTGADDVCSAGTGAHSLWQGVRRRGAGVLRDDNSSTIVLVSPNQKPPA